MLVKPRNKTTLRLSGNHDSRQRPCFSGNRYSESCCKIIQQIYLYAKSNKTKKACDSVIHLA